MSEGATIGRIVWYRSKTGSYSCPAIITATVGSLHQPNVEAGHIAPLSGPDHVHLSVLTPGKPGHVSDDTRENHPDLVRNPAPMGLYQETDIPFWQPDDLSAPFYAPGDASPQPAGTWTWPQRT